MVTMIEPMPTWNATAVEFPNLCVHELFEQQAARTPDAPAVVFGDQQLSYRQLNERANQVAHCLRRRCVGPESLVGVAMHRTPALLAALLGVWKAGGAYVPIDPAYPSERLSFMVRDAELRLVLTEQEFTPLFADTGAETICLDTDWPTIGQESAVNPHLAMNPAHLAYVMYTSGSTGQPKGAMIVHSGLVNYLCWAVATYGVTAESRVPVHSPISFDLTVTSLYPPLLAGGCVELLPEDAGAQNLLAALQQPGERSLVKITPAHLDLLSRQVEPAAMAAMSKVFVIGGEALSADQLLSWRQNAPATRLINEYGPTETVVGCCIHEVQPDDPLHGAVPIGRPIANTRLYVLDEAMQPLPPGQVGELYIGGVGVARGYLNRPELTQEKFLPDPFSDESDARLYRSGDLARYRTDGVLEYVGRADHQVKINGYRIEPGEVEACLGAHPAVHACSVMAREDEAGNRHLVAWVVPQAPQSPTGEALRDFMKAHLPAFMLPSRFVFLDALPLTRNGKVDRAALPAPSPENSAATADFVPPGTSTEQRLAAIWCPLLGLGQIGIHDNVFDLGARSLQAVKAMAQMRNEFAVDIQLRHLFERPSIAGLAEVIEGLAWLDKSGSPRNATPDREELAL